MGRKVSKEEYHERMNIQHPDIEIIGEYKNFSTKVKLKCKKDGYEWETTPNKSLNSNHGCPKCGGSLPLTHEDFVNQMKNINPLIEFESNYINDGTKIKCHCLKCDNRWENTPGHLKTGEKCPVCSKIECSLNLTKGMKEFKEQLKKINPLIKILSKKYQNDKTKLKCECLICHYKWYATPSNLLRYRGCPKCKKSSLGEKRIVKWLEENNISYEYQFTFKDCKDKRALPFDFYINGYNFLIEYDGQQHFFPVKFNNMSITKAIYNYLETIRRDKIKDDYCRKNKIFMIRIPYWYLNSIEDVLESIFKNRAVLT